MSSQSPDAPAPLPTPRLRWRCDPDSFPFETTDEVERPTSIIGQDIAVEALQFGLETTAPGQNVYVRGLTGTGRSTLVRRLIESIRPGCPLAPDRCYVYNFAQPDRPRLLSLERGSAESFRRRVDRFITFLREDFAAGLSSDVVKNRAADIERTSSDEMREAAKPFEDELRENDLVMLSVETGPGTRQVIAPLIDGQPGTPEKIEELRREGKMSEADVDALREKVRTYADKMRAIGEIVQALQLKRMESLGDVVKSEAGALLTGALAGLRRDFPGDDVQRFFEEIVEDVIEQRLGELKDGGFVERYRVNVVLHHKEGDVCPAIEEYAPSVQSLLGSIDRTLDPKDDVFAPQMVIRGGSLLRSDGGFLVVEALDLLSEPGAWNALLRTLRSGHIEMVPPSMPVPWQLPALKPEPIPVNLKVIMIGDANLYYRLDSANTGFSDYFKVLADFETTIDRDGLGIGFYASILKDLSANENLLPFHKTAVARLCEHGSRIAAQEDKLTARFGRLADIAREAVFLARRAEQGVVTAEYVDEAIRRTKRRANLPGRRFGEMIAKGVIRVHTRGTSVGEVNGLAVMSAGPLTYGFPARITATIGAGSAGAIDVERASNLSGRIHTKGFYILGGLLRTLLRTTHPLTFSASVAFEQSYGGIDGDSASGAEMCCLLSALTDVPLRQDLAMTGAIDQVGHIQPIGGVNEKIEGFFDVCQAAGFTGTQGVIIPKTNTGDLMLRQDVVDACDEGQFAIYAVDTIHEALALFTGMPVGQRDDAGEYPEGSLFALATEKAHRYWEMVARQGDFARKSQESEDEQTEDGVTDASMPGAG